MNETNGEIEISISVTGSTLSEVEALMPPLTALMVVLPAATPVASPAELIVGAAVLEELQVTALVRSCVLSVLKLPVAVNCSGSPTKVVAGTGDSTIASSAGAVTVSVVEAETLPKVALIAEVPAVIVEARPEALIVATAAVPELHVTLVVMSAVLPLLY